VENSHAKTKGGWQVASNSPLKYHLRLDRRGRLYIPGAVRQQWGREVIVVPCENHLRVYTPEQWANLMAQSFPPPRDDRAASMLRYLTARAALVSFTPDGRIVLPASLWEGLIPSRPRRLLLAVYSQHAEIWDAEGEGEQAGQEERERQYASFSGKHFGPH